MCRGTLTVHRKDYYRKDGTYVKGSTYDIEDKGAPGRGKAILPPVKRPGAMTEVAIEMGYDKPSDVLIKDIPEYVDNLVKKYGQRSAQGMLRRQLVYRKRTRVEELNGTSGRIFQRMQDYLSKAYAKRGWE